MGKIRRLQDNIINLIAAGEVVERPASVVKELAENSLDAGATEIIIKVEEGGTKSIAVIDNGEGMDEDDARLAFAQHATSKIFREEDLANIGTMGFRGEALASIRSIAEIELETLREGSNPVKLRVFKDEENVGPGERGSIGTTIRIAKLFESVPARKKFLRASSTELAHITNTFLSLALVNTSIHWELHHNSKLLHRLPATSGITERLFDIWGSGVADNIFDAKVKVGNVKLNLYLGSPDIARRDRKLQYIFVNGRPVSDRLVQKAALDGYAGFIHKDLHPVYFINIQLPADEVDVNVHPRKQEVKFRNTQQIFSLVSSSVKQTLSSATRKELLGRLAPPATHELRNTEVATEPSIPRSMPPRGMLLHDSGWGARKPRPGAALSFTKQLLTGGERADLPPAQTAPYAMPQQSSQQFFQIFATYIVYQQEDKVVFVDQHAAAEKILFEKLLESADTAKSNPLLLPEVFDFSKGEVELVLKMQASLGKLGIELAHFGGESIQVTAKPSITPNLNVKTFLDELLQHQRDTDIQIDDHVDVQNPAVRQVIATIACHGAIRAGQLLSQTEMRQLITDLAKCSDPYNCPHGRPVSWVLSRGNLEDHFKRKL